MIFPAFDSQVMLGLLKLSRPVQFEPVGQVTTVFFDDRNQQVFSVRSGGATGVFVRGPGPGSSLVSCRISDQGPVVSIKLSPGQDVLGVQRAKNSVEFIRLGAGAGGEYTREDEFSQQARVKNCVILGFFWTSASEVVLITDMGLELFSVNPERRSCKFLRATSVGVAWYCTSPTSSFLVTAARVDTKTLQVWSLRSSTCYKLGQVDLPCSVLDKEVSLLEVCGACLLRVNMREEGEVQTINLYTLTTEQVNWSHTLSGLACPGSVAVQTLDNLLLVHSQTQASTWLYDLHLQGQPHPLHPGVTLVKPALPSPTTISGEEGNSLLTYPSGWVVFLPNILVEARLGLMWTLQLCLDQLVIPQPGPLMAIETRDIPHDQPLTDECSQVITDEVDQLPTSEPSGHLSSSELCEQQLLTSESRDPSLTTKSRDQLLLLTRLLLNRDAGKAPLLRLLSRCVHLPHVPLSTLSSMLTSLVAAYQAHQANTATCPTVVLDQADIFTNVLAPTAAEGESHLYSDSHIPTSGVPLTRLHAVLLEYLLCLEQQGITPRQFLHELLINLAVKTGQFYQLHQLLQYHVVRDSKQVACLLLSLESVYQPARQLALDMMTRLGTATDEILEIFLAEGKLISALSLVKANGLVDTVSARKFLEAAEKTGDEMVFFNVFSFFEERNLRLRGSGKFSRGEQCEVFVTRFKDMFVGVSDG